VIAVLCIGAAVAAPFGLDMTSWRAWLGAAALLLTGILIAHLAMALIDVDADVASHAEYEITKSRLATLSAIGTPPDVYGVLDGLHDGIRWSGSAADFRKALYGRLGEKRGAVYLPRVLPYLAIYSPEPEKKEVVDTPESDLPITEQKLRSRSLNL
jgi:hypothetical protein